MITIFDVAAIAVASAFVFSGGFLPGLIRRRQKRGAQLENERQWRVHEILTDCYNDLRRQKAAGYGPWIASCVEKGGAVTPEVALTAIKWTRNELSGSRFSLSVINDSIYEIESLVDTDSGE